MTAIFKRELKSYFESMTGYIFIAFMILFMGIYFLAYNFKCRIPIFFLCTVRYAFDHGNRDSCADDALFCR